LLYLVLCKSVLDRLFGSFNCLLSFPCFNFCVVTDLLLGRLMCSFCPYPGGII
jgi:hypothetical protein